jgi:hypothetical protein
MFSLLFCSVLFFFREILMFVLIYVVAGVFKSTSFVKLLEGAFLSYYKHKLLHGDRLLMNLLDSRQQKTQNKEAISMLINDRKLGLAFSLTAVLNLACSCRKALSGDLMLLGMQYATHCYELV